MWGLINGVYGTYSILKGFSFFGFWAVLLIPLWLLFCYFTGIPGIINLLRTSNYWKRDEFFKGLIANIITASILFVILEFANAHEMQSNFLIGGILSAFGMPKHALLRERFDDLQQTKDDNINK